LRFSIVYMGMKNRQEKSKLYQLRARTDRELIALIERRLEAGLRTDGASAEKVYLEVAPLLLVANVDPDIRSQLEAKLNRLEECFSVCAIG
jgi:hypothetical protein